MTAPGRVKVAARVRLTIDVTCPDVWDENASSRQVFNTASKEVREQVRRLFENKIGFTIVGEPAVTMVLVEEVK